MKRGRKTAIAGTLALLGLFGLLALSRQYSKGPSSPGGWTPTKPDPSLAALVDTDQVLARVDGASLHGADLKIYLHSVSPELQGGLLLENEEMNQKVATALDQLIADEILAREARKQGFQSRVPGGLARQDLARQLVRARAEKLPEVSDAELRAFYGSHGEKFTEAPANRVREWFLPFQAGDKILKKQGPTFELAGRLKSALASQSSIDWERLAGQHTPPEHRQKSKGYVFSGGVVDPAEEQIVLSLPPGRVAGPFRVEGGLSFFQGVEYLRQRFIPFYQAKETIQKYLEAERLAKVRRQLLEDLSRAAKVEKYDPASRHVVRSSFFDRSLIRKS